ncbi:MAG: O-acetyl-ADP-ribose deacetylase [Acidobacteria bacterium]|nr:O-acetyl-ADP-ribose deacetylase [Acidobacteriota bacterium]
MSSTFLAVGNCGLYLEQGDITRSETDAVVNAANSGLRGGGGVDGAIHRAGGPEIMAECRQIIRQIGFLPPGQAVRTGGGRLPAQHVIHTVGPVWQGGHASEAEQLASCYRTSLDIARTWQCRSVAFPSISTGVYGYPLAQAAPVALRAVTADLRRQQAPDKVIFFLFDDRSYSAYAQALEQLAAETDT